MGQAFPGAQIPQHAPRHCAVVKGHDAVGEFLFLFVPFAGNDYDIPAVRSGQSRSNRLCAVNLAVNRACLLYTSPSPRDGLLSRMPSSA